ncbi:hypothetical protein ACLQ3D_28630 [Micromonospora vinacea]|uniref:Membrane protein YdjX (TVP38/TMEM64 family) n=1 Tax=Micromonospora vinacea TaxID=709878 RepID=A0ABS0K6R6_9ACTN|nr:hypothetical protein [Micromonospora vinacea]MBG6104323.1 putative membrane protein YdjX (TVP38/TMEM64 family) [Micromonospora vinacea]
MKRPTLGILLMVLGTIVGYVLASTVGERNPDAFVGTSAVIIILVLAAVLVHLLRRRRQQRD